MKGNFHVQCGVRENLKITSKSYLSLWYKIAKKKKLTGAKRVAYVAGYVAVNSINPFKAVRKVSRAVKAVKKGSKVLKSTKKLKIAKPLLKKTKKLNKVNLKKKVSTKKNIKKKAVTEPKKRRKGNAPKIKFVKKKKNVKRIKFKGDEANNHFKKHGKEIMDTLGKNSYNLKEYIDDANYIIKNGQYTPELNGYVKFMGGKGHAKYGFVGLDRKTGRITTFHVKGVKELEKKAPSLGIRRW